MSSRSESSAITPAGLPLATTITSKVGGSASSAIDARQGISRSMRRSTGITIETSGAAVATSPPRRASSFIRAHYRTDQRAPGRGYPSSSRSMRPSRQSTVALR